MSGEEDAMLRAAVRALLHKLAIGVSRAADAAGERDSWQALIGGMRLGEVELEMAQAAIILEEVGRARTIGPFADALVAGWLLDRCGADAARDLAASVRAGERLAVLAWAEPGMRYAVGDTALTAHRNGDGWRLSGMKSVVGWAPAADVLIVSARTAGEVGDAEGLSLFLVANGGGGAPQAHRYRTIDGQSAADLQFDDCEVDGSALVGPLGGAAPLLEEARDRAMALLAAEAVGLLDATVEQTIAYTGQRRQFGRPIAEFQALQHRMVDMYLESELARSSAWLAVQALDQDPAARARAVSSAMVNVAEAGRFVGEQAIQLHGGMGMTDDLAIGHYAKRLMAIEVAWADTDWHLARIAQGRD